MTSEKRTIESDQISASSYQILFTDFYDLKILVFQACVHSF